MERFRSIVYWRNENVMSYCDTVTFII